MTSQWRHRNKTHSWYSELNSLQNVYFGFFIFGKLIEWRCFVTYLWNDPRIIKKICVYFTHLSRSPHGWICMKFCTGGHLTDIINRAKFFSIRLGVSILWGSNFWLSHRNEMSPLTRGLNYRSACDTFQWYVCVLVIYWPNVSSDLC